MTDKKKSMPPELLAHFKKKQEQTEGSEGGSKQSPEERKEGDKERRKEAVKRARIRIEEKNRGAGRDEEKEAGKASS